MSDDEYERIRKRGSGRAYCDNCDATTDFTVDEYGVVFCVSCGIEPEPESDL